MYLQRDVRLLDPIIGSREVISRSLLHLRLLGPLPVWYGKSGYLPELIYPDELFIYNCALWYRPGQRSRRELGFIAYGLDNVFALQGRRS